MANFQFDNVHIDNGKLLVCEDGVTPRALRTKANEGKHSAYIEGPLQVGNPGDFNSSDSNRIATVMIGKDGNAGAIRALFVKGDVTIVGNTKQEGNTDQIGTITLNRPKALNAIASLLRGTLPEDPDEPLFLYGLSSMSILPLLPVLREAYPSAAAKITGSW